jgi:hypothetical protein
MPAPQPSASTSPGCSPKVWREGEGFSGKRPFGNSGWEWDLYVPMVRAGFVTGKFDEDGYAEELDDDSAEELILAAIDAMGRPSAAPSIDLHRWYAVVRPGDGTSTVIGHTDDGLATYESAEQWEAANS